MPKRRRRFLHSSATTAPFRLTFKTEWNDIPCGGLPAPQMDPRISQPAVLAGHGRSRWSIHGDSRKRKEIGNE